MSPKMSFVLRAASAACLLATLISPARATESKPARSRKKDPAIGSKAREFVKNAAIFRAYSKIPKKAKTAKKAKETLLKLEKYSWKGLAKAFNKYFFGVPIPGSKSKRTLQKKVDGLPVIYYFDLPRGYSPSKAWPLCIALHGGGAGSGDGTEAMSTFGRVMGNMGAIVAAPTAPELLDGAWNCPRGYRVVRALIEEIGAHYHVDWNKIYVGGHSMGGYGSYFEALWWPDRFAAHLSSAGGISAGSVCDFEVIYNTPVFVIHGTEDNRQAPIAFVRAADKAIKMMPLKPRFYSYLEIEGAGHGFDGKYRKQAAKSMLRHTRDPYPKKVVCVCPNYWDSTPGRQMGNAKTGRAFWVEILARSGTDFDNPAKVVAERGPDPNTITVTTPPIQRIKHKGPEDINVEIIEMTNTVLKIGICLAEEFVDLSKPVKIVCNGFVVFEDFVDRSVETLLDHLERTGDPGMPFSARVDFSVN